MKSAELIDLLLADLDRYQAEANSAAIKYKNQVQLVETMRSQYPELFAGTTSDVASAKAADSPRGRTAVLAVMDASETGKMASTEIVTELQTRGWLDAVDPGGAVRMSLRRLVKDGKVRKLNEKRGRAYLFQLIAAGEQASLEIPEAPAETGASDHFYSLEEGAENDDRHNRNHHNRTPVTS